MPDPVVELEPVPVLRLRADFQGKGPPAAFATLEGKLPTLKGRKFYGTFRFSPAGPEYYACVARLDTEDPARMGLDAGTIPGGSYARRRLSDWKTRLSELPALFQTMASEHAVDPSRPSVEFYRSQTEMHLYLPVRTSPPTRT